VKLQRQLSARGNGKDYYRYMVNLPKSAIILLGWLQGDSLVIKKCGKKLLMMKKEDWSK